MQTTTIETKKRYQCRHIFTDGRRCGSACLRHEDFCYYRHTTRRPVENPGQRRSRRTTFELPLPEDRSAIQHSIGEVLRRIATNDIDPRRAGLLLYGLQIASLNLPKPQQGRKYAPEIETVEEITLDPTHGPLAPKIEVEKAGSSILRVPRYDRRDPVRRIRYAMRDGHTSTIHRTRNTLRTSSDRGHRKSRHRDHASLFLHPTPNKRHLGRRRRLHRTTKASS